MWRVTLYSLCVPPSPQLYRDFETEAEAERWKAWSACLPCHARLRRQS